MDKKIIQQLVENSFTESKLDNSKALAIAEKLNRTHLKIYIKLLRAYIASHTILVESAFPINDKTKKDLQDTYHGKDIQHLENKDLMVGVKITDNDIIYSRNLKNTLENIKDYLTN